MTLMDKVDEYQNLLSNKESLAEATKENNKALETCRDELAKMMVDEECSKINRSGFTYTLQEKTKYSKKASAEDELFELLQENGLGDLIKPTVNAQTLQGAMSNLAEENGGELPEDFVPVISVYSYLDIGRRRDK